MKNYLLKNGETLNVRKAQKVDAINIIQYVNNVAEESDNLTFGKGEFNLTVEDEEKIIEEALNSNNSIFIIGELNGEIVSYLTFIGGKRPRIQHMGEFGMSVLKDYWGLGIGKSLLDYLLKWAKNSKVIRKINLKVRTDNKNAIKMYEAMGFKYEGTIARFFYLDGKFYDSFEMGLEID